MKLLLTFIACLLLAACATGVNVDYRSEADFKKIKSFSIEKKPANTTTDTRIDTPFMQERTVEALRSALTNKGFYYQKDKPDVIVRYHLVIKQEFETDDSGVYLGFGTATHHSIIGMSYAFPERQVASVDDLVLTIDIVDPGNILLWRGSLARRLFSGSTPEKNNQLIQGLVQDILKQFPPK
jgi:hypothetical protein